MMRTKFFLMMLAAIVMGSQVTLFAIFRQAPI